MTNLACMCNPSAEPQMVVAACVYKACTIPEMLQAQKFTTELCMRPTANKAPLILGLVWGFEALGFIAMALRLLSRFAAQGGGFGWDDLVALVIMVANIGAGSMITVATVKYGYGQDIWMLTPDQITNCLKYLLMVTPVYIFSVGGLKITLILFYLRIFDSDSGNRRFRILCWATMGVVAIYSLVNIFLSIFVCHSISYLWTIWDGDHEGECGDRKAAGLSHVVLNVLVDLILLGLPVFGLSVPKLFNLRLATSKELLIIVMFAFGLITTVCSVVRLVDIGRWELTSSPNLTVSTISFMIWTIAECEFGLICACIPMAAQGLRAMRPQASKLNEPSGTGSPSEPKSSSTSQRVTQLWNSTAAPWTGRRRVRDPVSLLLESIDESPDDTESEIIMIPKKTERLASILDTESIRRLWVMISMADHNSAGASASTSAQSSWVMISVADRNSARASASTSAQSSGSQWDAESMLDHEKPPSLGLRPVPHSHYHRGGRRNVLRPYLAEGQVEG
ncbi:Uu.00g141230.m01.CDS01 [Anthostomella pinea]|uniref:Uu.00g141230.m01.CDS01 n=1 Tax=Anthostomella pinea TaxID=933095 RepID=A0AAI8VQ95_9PEZI|nr:Uu.00g141230.m01.CDS01 [Anthostomella pinea]